MLETGEQANFELFRDCLSTILIENPATPPTKTLSKRNDRKSRKHIVDKGISEPIENNDAEELSEFIDYTALQIFTSLPPELCTLTYSTYSHDPTLRDRYSPPLTLSNADDILQNLDPAGIDSLTAYELLTPSISISNLLLPVLNSYCTTLTAAPPPPSTTRDQANGCEICERDWVPLTYHHLIPRFVHAKVLKRGWHAEEDLGNVAWLCRACHSFVHRVATNEELAREFYTVELLLEREDVQKFAQWVSRVRFKAR